jgi:hypothetical protein
MEGYGGKGGNRQDWLNGRSMASDFTLAGYRALLNAFTERGYITVRYEDARPDRRDLILRHDIDMSLTAALGMAELEAEMGHSAHYFVLVRSALYNTAAPANRRVLLRLRELGHRVGLHLDASHYPDDDDALDAGCAIECAALKVILGEEPIPVVSLHRPAPRLQGSPRRIGGRRHTYEPAIFSEIGYCSDSRGDWRHGHPLEQPAVAAGRALQLLTHPIWWTREPGESAVARLDRLRLELDRQLAEELAANCDIYREPAAYTRLAS